MWRLMPSFAGHSLSAAGVIAACAVSVAAGAAEPTQVLYERLTELQRKRQQAVSEALASGGGTWAAVAANLPLASESEIERELLLRARNGDHQAAHFVGVSSMQECRAVNRLARQQDENTARRLAEISKGACDSAVEFFQVASRAGVGAASWNLALMYENGIGVLQSKLVAAEWYAKAGAQFLKARDRTMALTALERVEAIDTNHPEGMALRASLFPAKPAARSSK